MSDVQQEVELDLDDVEEQSLEVEQKNEVPEETVKDAVGEVDLGYKDPIEESEKPQAEPSEEPQAEKAEETNQETKKKDNLQDVSEKTQKRIDKLTRKMREAERREKAAIDYAKGLQEKYEGAEKNAKLSDENHLKEYDARVDAQREQVRIKLQDAIEANDSAKIVEANDELTKLAVEKEKARMRFAELEAQKEKDESQTATATETPPQQTEAVPPSKKAQAWAEKNTWFGDDEVMTNAAFSIHAELVKEGFDSESDEYYNEIDSRLQDYFPNKFAVSEPEVEEKKPVQTVASAGRKQQGRRTVKLTRSQVAIAKKLGVPLEEYAKFVKE